jgi:hypothetical protein
MYEDEDSSIEFGTERSTRALDDAFVEFGAVDNEDSAVELGAERMSTRASKTTHMLSLR